MTEDAIDSLRLVFKQQREEVKNLLHARKAEQVAKNKAGKRKVWDVHLTVFETLEKCTALLGKLFVVRPRQAPGGMVKLGRSTGDDFQDGVGVSLAHDDEVSTWHGKVRARARARHRHGQPARGAGSAALVLLLRGPRPPTRPLPHSPTLPYMRPAASPPPTCAGADHIRVRRHLFHRLFDVWHAAQRVRVRGAVVCVLRSTSAGGRLVCC